MLFYFILFDFLMLHINNCIRKIINILLTS